MGRIKIKNKTIVFLLLLAFGSVAQAVPVRWEMTDVVVAYVDYVDDGSLGLIRGSLSGSFIYDADTNGVHQVQITGQFGDYDVGYASTIDSRLWFEDWNYDGDDPNNWHGDRSYELEIIAFDPITNDGGVVEIRPGSAQIGPPRAFNQIPVEYQGSGEIYCDVFDGCGYGYGENYIESGYLVGTVVPVPATVWLLGSALAGLGWLRRRTA